MIRSKAYPELITGILLSCLVFKSILVITTKLLA
jgi:hypothetical protein